MAKEVEDIEFDELMADKRHKELKGILTAVKSVLDKPADTSTAAAIQKMAGDLTKLLSEQKPPQVTVESPDVKVEVNQEKVITSIEKLLPELIKFNNRPIPSQFDVINDGWNLKTVKIIYKTKEELNYKK